VRTLLDAKLVVMNLEGNPGIQSMVSSLCMVAARPEVAAIMMAERKTHISIAQLLSHPNIHVRMAAVAVVSGLDVIIIINHAFAGELNSFTQLKSSIGTP
jgi:hypothetical protein